MYAMRLPSVDSLLNASSLAPLTERYGRMVVRNALRDIQSGQRRGSGEGCDSSEDYAREASARLERALGRRGEQVFNMTGVLLHSNLGRAVLDPEVTASIARRAAGPTLLEMDADSGKRGDRESSAIASLLALTGAEAGTIVNNNAAAVMLVLAGVTNARRNQIIVSRGELVEIGGSFRLPDIMRAAGVKLVEAGATNVTRPDDYAQAITDRTALILKVHTSNYRISGYAQSTSLRALAKISDAARVPLCMDLGSGCLADLTRFGLPREPRVSDALEQGAQLVTCSGDKLLGSVQVGIILGRSELIARIRRHPLKRALRLDKIRLALFQETLKAWQEPAQLATRVPLFRQLARTTAELTASAKHLRDVLMPLLDAKFTEPFACEVAPHACEMGSGSMPGANIPSVAIKIECSSQAALKRLEVMLRHLPIPVLGRLHAGCLWLDLRAVEDLTALQENLEVLRST